MSDFTKLPTGKERLVIDHSKIEVDPDAFIKKAKWLVAEEFNFRYSLENSSTALTIDNFYIVWFTKVLGNWKALVSTDSVNGHYWEVTYNGAKQETYVDTYSKAFNRAYPDSRPWVVLATNA